MRVISQFGVEQSRGDIGDRPPYVAGDQLGDLARLAGEAPHAQTVIQKQRGDVGAVQQILHVVVRAREFIQSGLQFLVDRVQFFVHGLHLFL